VGHELGALAPGEVPAAVWWETHRKKLVLVAVQSLVPAAELSQMLFLDGLCALPSVPS
jgi:hypothetical protein